MKPINEMEKRKIIKGLLSMLKIEEDRLTEAVSDHNSNSVFYICEQMRIIGVKISTRYIDPLEHNNYHNKAFYEEVDEILIRCGIRRGPEYYRKKRVNQEAGR